MCSVCAFIAGDLAIAEEATQAAWVMGRRRPRRAGVDEIGRAWLAHRTIVVEGAHPGGVTSGGGVDTDLVRRAMRGDERAFTEIVNSVTDRFLGVAQRILRDRTLAEDAVQQALLSAWRDLSDLRDSARFEGWAYRLLIHACYMEVRKRRRWHPTTIVRSITEPTAPDLINGIIERDRLERGFERLSIDHLAVLVGDPLRHDRWPCVWRRGGPTMALDLSLDRSLLKSSPGAADGPVSPACAGSALT